MFARYKGKTILKATIRKVLFISLLNALVISTSCTISAQPNKKPSNSSLGWRSNPTYSRQLAPAVKVDSFYISPPAGFTFQKKQSQNNVKLTTEYDWRGPAGPDGTKPRLVVVIFKLLPGAVDDRTAEEQINSGLDAMSNGEKHYIHTGIEHGKVNGMSFVRAFWKRDPNDPDEGKRFHGFQYQYAQGSTSVSIIASDVEPHYKTTLDFLEAAALTFHK